MNGRNGTGPVLEPRTSVAGVEPADVPTLIAEACAGRTIIVAGQSTVSGLTAASLANEGLLAALALPGAAEQHCRVTGAATVFISDERGPCGHCALWDEAGDLHEKLLAEAANGDAPSHIFAFGTAAAEAASILDTTEAVTVLIDDSAERVTPSDREYWSDVDRWLASKKWRRVAARALLRAVSPPEWPSGAAGETTVTSLGGALGGKRVVLIDEAGDRPPSPIAVEAVLKLCDPARDRLVLLTRHAQSYERSRLPDDALVMDARNLSRSVYMGLLSLARIYVAPAGLPFGSPSLRCLPRNSRRFVLQRDDWPVREDEDGLCVSRRIEPLLSELASALSPRESTTAPTIPRAEEPAASPMEGWWRQLGQITERGESPAPKRDLAILLYCHKYLQRLRGFLDSVARQDCPLERIEVCVATCGNPDGVFEYLDLFQAAHPKLGVRRVDMPESERRNRGKMINAAFSKSTARAVMAADCDIILPRHFTSFMLRELRADTVLGCGRVPLSPAITAQTVTGNLDPVAHFDALCGQWDAAQAQEVRQGVLGYCQVIAREALVRVPYPEEFDCINQSDIVFVERLAEKMGVSAKFLRGIVVLHQHHPRNWSGTEVFL